MPDTGAPLSLPLMALDGERLPSAKFNEAMQILNTDAEFVGARVYNNANISINNNTDTALTFNSERYDSSAIHSTSTNTGRLTFPVAGKWRVHGNVRFAANATGIRAVYIVLNGTTIIGNVLGNNTGATFQPTLQVSADYGFALNDYVTLNVFQDSGGALNVLVVGNYSPEFWCQYLGV